MNKRNGRKRKMKKREGGEKGDEKIKTAR